MTCQPQGNAQNVEPSLDMTPTNLALYSSQWGLGSEEPHLQNLLISFSLAVPMWP